MEEYDQINNIIKTNNDVNNLQQRGSAYAKKDISGR